MRAERRLSGAAVGALTSVLTGALYAVTLAPDLTWAFAGGDGGELITAAVTLGVPHPPGYPTFVLIGHLIGRIPLGSVAARFNAFSAVTVAAAAGLIAMTAYARLPQDRRAPAALAAGLSLAAAPVVWGQATIAEVYGLNLLAVALLLWLLLATNATWRAGVLLGLSVTTHLTSLLLLPLAVWLRRDRLLRLGSGALIGVLPLLALPLLAQSDSPVRWGDATTPAGWWWLVSGALFRPNVLALPLPDLAARLPVFALTLLRQFSYVGWLLLAVPGDRRLGDRRPGDRRRDAPLLLTALAYLLYAVTYRADDYSVLILPALALLSVRLAGGLRPAGWLALALPLVTVGLNFSLHRQAVAVGVRAAAQPLLATLPADAIVLTPGDATIFSLWYFQHVENARPDLALVDRNLFAFDWYRAHLGRIYPDLTALAVDDLTAFAAANGSARPLCAVTLSAPAGADCRAGP